jgi:hypothetical protein
VDEGSYENNEDEGGFYGDSIDGGASGTNSSMMDSEIHYFDDPDSSRNNDS